MLVNGSMDALVWLKRAARDRRQWFVAQDGEQLSIRRVVIVLATVALFSAGCSSVVPTATTAGTSTADSSYIPPTLTDQIFSTAFTGIVERRYSGDFDPPRRPDTTWLVKVTDVDFQGDVLQRGTGP
ncbi:MAG: hypothetical protein GXP34_01195, partial [Actinobacteria bacterium]|nr:hypothetical protein [Actinomycetota bacterium]